MNKVGVPFLNLRCESQIRFNRVFDDRYRSETTYASSISARVLSDNSNFDLTSDSDMRSRGRLSWRWRVEGNMMGGTCLEGKRSSLYWLVPSLLVDGW